MTKPTTTPLWRVMIEAHAKAISNGNCGLSNAKAAELRAVADEIENHRRDVHAPPSDFGDGFQAGFKGGIRAVVTYLREQAHKAEAGE